jgi:hypothetical protein
LDRKSLSTCVNSKKKRKRSDWVAPPGGEPLPRDGIKFAAKIKLVPLRVVTWPKKFVASLVNAHDKLAIVDTSP